jgi:hypothetical protein
VKESKGDNYEADVHSSGRVGSMTCIQQLLLVIELRTPQLISEYKKYTALYIIHTYPDRSRVK